MPSAHPSANSNPDPIAPYPGRRLVRLIERSWRIRFVIFGMATLILFELFTGADQYCCQFFNCYKIMGAEVMTNLAIVVDEASSNQALADGLRLIRLFLHEVEASGPIGARLTPDSPLISVARQLLDAGPTERAANRTALMLLRDVTWRMESALHLVKETVAEPESSALVELLDTTEIRAFLKQEP